ncbi:MAG: iron-containing redox enzyme family protein, partial [Caulobacteraceae bacterium]|nr:iron-containing redox enzyme family protein [Caulobacteraceae bacterium]
TDVDGFVAWFEVLAATGPGQHDPLFAWLARDAGPQAMGWFLTQEAAGEAGFDDLVAMAQVKLPASAKLELARNYWDEMGRGAEGGMHGPMLDRAVRDLELTPTIDGTLWQSLALANTLTAFSTTRRYAWHAVGALGVVELTAPGRVAQVAKGLERLGYPPSVRRYFELHARLDVKHAQDWIANALRPLVSEDPARIPFLAEGALMRLVCGARCFEAYRARLWSAPAMHMAAE